MAIIYLDWNVFTAARQGTLAPGLVDLLRTAVLEGFALVPFTAEHVIEAARDLGDSEADAARLRVALAGVAEITGCTYWSFDLDSGEDAFSSREPADIHDKLFRPQLPRSEDEPDDEFRGALNRVEALGTVAISMVNDTICRLGTTAGIDTSDLLVTEVPRTHHAWIRAGTAMSEAGRRAARAAEGAPLNIDPSRISAPGSEVKVIPIINERLRDTISLDVDELMSQNAARRGALDLRAAQLNGLLQLAGYRRDGHKKSGANLSSDAMHLVYGLHSSVFISRDSKLRARAQVIVEHLKLETVILDPEQAVELLQGFIVSCRKADGRS